MDDYELAEAVYGLPDDEREVVQEMHSNAVHFTTKHPWEPERAALDRLLTVARDVSKQIAHVTTARIGNGIEEPATVLLLEPESAAEVIAAVRRLWDDLVRHTDVPWPRVGLFPVWTDAAGKIR